MILPPQKSLSTGENIAELLITLQTKQRKGNQRESRGISLFSKSSVLGR